MEFQPNEELLNFMLFDWELEDSVSNLKLIEFYSVSFYDFKKIFQQDINLSDNSFGLKNFLFNKNMNFDKMNKDVTPSNDLLKPGQEWIFSKTGWRRSTKLTDE